MNKIRGAYHFYIYSDDPEVQANHFCEVVTDLDENDISLILDIEELEDPKEAPQKTIERLGLVMQHHPTEYPFIHFNVIKGEVNEWVKQFPLYL